MRVTIPFFVLALTVAAAAAGASTLDVLRHRLTELPGTSAINGRIDVVMDETTKKEHETRRGGAEFDVDSSALRVTIPARDLSPESDQPRRNAPLITMPDIWWRLNCAPALLGGIRRATVVTEQVSAWRGQPARRLELRIEPEAMGDAPKFLKMKVDTTLIIWVAPDGTPLASERQDKISARILLFSASGGGKKVVQYVINGDRLIAAHDAEESFSSGMGEEGQQKRTTTVTLRR